LNILRIFKVEIPSPFSLYRLPGNPLDLKAHKITMDSEISVRLAKYFILCILLKKQVLPFPEFLGG